MILLLHSSLAKMRCWSAYRIFLQEGNPPTIQKVKKILFGERFQYLSPCSWFGWTSWITLQENRWCFGVNPRPSQGQWRGTRKKPGPDCIHQDSSAAWCKVELWCNNFLLSFWFAICFVCTKTNLELGSETIKPSYAREWEKEIREKREKIERE